jgi:hypothetical protein
MKESVIMEAAKTVATIEDKGQRFDVAIAFVKTGALDGLPTERALHWWCRAMGHTTLKTLAI